MSIKAMVGGCVGQMFPRTWQDIQVRRRPWHYEPELFLVHAFCSRNQIAVDVGGNVGIYAYELLRHSSSVVVFEPNQRLWPHLRRMLGPKARLEASALSDSQGTAPLRYVDQNTGVATIESQNTLSMIDDRGTIKTETVQMRTLDSFDLTDVSFIKIDVEGHEESVVHGAEQLLRSQHPCLLVESEDRHNPGAPSRLTAHLAALGYRALVLKAGKLVDASALSPDDTVFSEARARDHAYVNNYIFVAADRPEQLDRLKAAASALPANLLRVLEKTSSTAHPTADPH